MRFVDAIHNPSRHADGRVSEGYIPELKHQLMDVYMSLNELPECRRVFMEAANLAFGAQFNGHSVTLGYINEHALPTCSRADAQLHVFERHITQWCDQQLANAHDLSTLDEVENLCRPFARATHQLCEQLSAEAATPASPQR